MDMLGRFNKMNVTAFIDRQMKSLEHDYGFKEGQGWSVVEGKDTETIVAFGQYDAYRTMLEEIFS